MDEILKIKNIGPIKDIELEVSPKLILIGPQASGKSIIAKIITILKSLRFLSGNVSFEELSKDYLIEDFFSANSYISFSCNKYTFTLSEGKSNLSFSDINFSNYFDSFFKEHVPNMIHWNKKELKDQYQAQLDTIKERLANLKDANKSNLELEKLEKDVDSLVESVKRSEKLEKDFYESFDIIQKYSAFSLYVPAERNLLSMISSSILSLTANKIPLPKLFIEFAASFERAKANIKTYEFPFFTDVKYSYTDGKDLITLNNGTISHELSRSSSGIQSLIPLLLILEDVTTERKIKYQTSFVVEEPEMNLFPETQYDLLKHLTQKISQSENNYLIITTHSPYFLSGANNLLLAHKVKEKRNDFQFVSIEPTRFNAYSIKGGMAKSVFDKTTGLIAENVVDSVSEIILNDFEYLMNQYKQSISK